MILLTPGGAYDRAAIMRNAHKRFKDGQRLTLGWTFAQCLATAWAAARMQRDRTSTDATIGKIAIQIEAHVAQMQRQQVAVKKAARRPSRPEHAR